MAKGARFDPVFLKPRLDALYEGFNYPGSATDPIQIVRRFDRPDDQEVIGFVAAALAFGRVASVLQSIEHFLEIVGHQPADYVKRFDPRRDAEAFARFGHRWIRAADGAALVWALRNVIERSGSIEAFFAEGHAAPDEDIGPALERFSQRVLEFDFREVYGRRAGKALGVRFFFSRPSTGGACKRLNLFLRWMVRRDELDLGAWTRISPSKLVVPLDTHVIRVARCLRMTRYTSPGWAMARDITAALRRIDPEDPIRYDFSLCHLGMMNACGFSRPQRDAQCPLRGACAPGGHKPSGSRRPSDRR